ncbi:IS66 family transposase [Bradyrhizobium sp. Tv2a-2]|uniref:IS66 family transposase n=1 Tax=Bradyrhizobium sp. Tv2a-2 TaxID=113395 RepID=UPI0003F936F0|nr:IS66 family transposase [Bradyrhizobium sp. Tv2a-2]
MKITSDLLHAYLKCSTKCWLRATNEPATENDYPKWVKAQNHSYRTAEVARLVAAWPTNEIARSPDLKEVNTASWRLATNLMTGAQLDSNILETDLHAIQLVPAKDRGPIHLIPIRFIFTNKLDKDDKLLLAFDALTLSQSLGREISVGKIVHGDNHATSKVKISTLVSEVRKRVDKIAVLLTGSAPPELVLNRHCAECEFQTRCHSEATQQDDLSLLSAMTAKERKKLNNRGTFTVKQLSFAFLPRRRPKKMRNKQERYHHSLKALAIREKKLHIAGRPELRIEDTPVFFDVEGIPDRDFYYLIGLRLRNGDSVVQHSLWADTAADEAQIYFQFLNILRTIDKPSLIHYGAFETEFLKQMGSRYGLSLETVLENNGNHGPTNLLSVINGQVYFPTYSNSLKSIARWLGFEWSNTSLTSVKSIACRRDWEASHNSALKRALVEYNAEDCQAAEIVAQTLLQLHSTDLHSGQGSEHTVYVESLRSPRKIWGPFKSEFKEFEKISAAAWWDYQRDRIWVRSKKLAEPRASQLRRAHLGPHSHLPVSRTIIYPKLSFCPSCGGDLAERSVCKRILYDLVFGKSSVKRWIVRCQFHYYWCSHCNQKFGEPKEFWPQSHLGRTLVAYVLYHTVELCIPFQTVEEILTRCVKLDICSRTLATVKRTAAKRYESTYKTILSHLLGGSLLHVDETQVSIRGATAYIWVFTNLHDVVYLYKESREGAFLQEMLNDFKGILVSDFFTAYDALNCDQQKCLIHLMRELNDNVLKHPYDEELKDIVREFAGLLKPIVDTVDRRGLKKRFLGKHQLDVERFYRKIAKLDCKSEEATKCRHRFVKNRNKLFTFLNHDGVPWHNNNAEHAIKAFSKLRDITRGSFTERSVKNDMILLSICQTCKYSNLEFFDFLRSGQTDIYAYAESVRGRRRTRRRQQAGVSQ